MKKDNRKEVEQKGARYKAGIGFVSTDFSDIVDSLSVAAQFPLHKKRSDGNSKVVYLLGRRCRMVARHDPSMGTPLSVRQRRHRVIVTYQHKGVGKMTARLRLEQTWSNILRREVQRLMPDVAKRVGIAPPQVHMFRAERKVFQCNAAQGAVWINLRLVQFSRDIIRMFLCLALCNLACGGTDQVTSVAIRRRQQEKMDEVLPNWRRTYEKWIKHCDRLSVEQ